jgi:hypothetical protein
MEKPITLIGVDLGQARDYTAISVIERGPVKTGKKIREEYWDVAFETYGTREVEETGLEYRVRHLERPPLGTPYPDVVERIVELVKKIGGEPVLCVDATGVGRPVTDMLWKRLEASFGAPR